MGPRAKTASKQRKEEQAEKIGLIEQKNQIEHIMKSTQYLIAPNIHSVFDQVGTMNNKNHLNNSQ